MKLRWSIGIAVVVVVIATGGWWIPRIGILEKPPQEYPPGEGPLPCWMLDASNHGGRLCFMDDGGVR